MSLVGHGDCSMTQPNAGGGLAERRHRMLFIHVVFRMYHVKMSNKVIELGISATTSTYPQSTFLQAMLD